MFYWLLQLPFVVLLGSSNRAIVALIPTWFFCLLVCFLPSSRNIFIFSHEKEKKKVQTEFGPLFLWGNNIYQGLIVQEKQPSTACRRKPLHTGVSTSDQQLMVNRKGQKAILNFSGKGFSSWFRLRFLTFLRQITQLLISAGLRYCFSSWQGTVGFSASELLDSSCAKVGKPSYRSNRSALSLFDLACLVSVFRADSRVTVSWFDFLLCSICQRLCSDAPTL